MSALRGMLVDYLEVRRSQGAQFTKVGPALAHFVEFLEERGAQRVTVELAIEWAKQATSASGRVRCEPATRSFR